MGRLVFGNEPVSVSITSRHFFTKYSAEEYSFDMKNFISPSILQGLCVGWGSKVLKIFGMIDADSAGSMYSSVTMYKAPGFSYNHNV